MAALSAGRNTSLDTRNRIALDLGGPLRVDRFHKPDDPKIKRQIRNIEEVSVLAEVRTGWEKQTARHPGFVDAVEIAELRDRLAGRVDNDDLVGLISRDPEVVVRIYHEDIGSV